MLVLSRRVGEGVCIGDDVKVSIVKVKGNQVRLMIEAPRTTSILREELLVELPTHRQEPARSKTPVTARQG
jgi:carbon storage regulator